LPAAFFHFQNLSEPRKSHRTFQSLVEVFYAQRIATLMIRSKDQNGERRYYRAYIAANGNAKPLFAVIAGKPELRPD
jgi:hypothetical protein